MASKNTTIKEVKGYSSAYPNICNLKLLPNVDGGWITIQDDIGTSMTIKLSDLSDFICCEECRAKNEDVEQAKRYCDNCLHKNVCGLEGANDEAMTYCADKLEVKRRLCDGC